MAWWLSAVAMAGGPTVHGWTADGLFVWESVHHDQEGAAEDYDFFPVVQLHAAGVDGVAHLQVSQRASEPSGEVDRGPIDAWLAEHSIVVARAARKDAAGVGLDVRAPTGAWEGASWKAKAAMYGDVDEAMAVGVVAAGGGFWELHRQTLEATAFGGHEYTVAAWFHPTQPLAAVVVDKAFLQTMRGPIQGSTKVLMVRTRPLVAVLAPPRLTDAAKAAAAKLGALGNVTTGEAKKDREATVVYFAAGFRSDAEAIAAEVGGTVEAMTWEAPQHVVVALGAP